MISAVSRSVLCSLLAVSLLGGCSYMPSWMGGSKKDQPKLAGERISVLPGGATVQIDEAVKDKPVTVPGAIENGEWPQHTGIFSASGSNFTLKGSLDSVQTASAGEGEAYENALVIRPVVGITPSGTLVFAVDAAGHVSAHDAADIDKKVWSIDGLAEDDEPPIMGGGLAFSEGKLYAASGRGVVAAFDGATGKSLWRKMLRVPLRSAPRVAGDKLFLITLDSQVFVLNTANGETLWNQRGIGETTELMQTVSPTVAGDRVVVPYASGDLYALSVADGRELWAESLVPDVRRQTSAFFAGIGGDPVVDGTAVFAVSSGGQLGVFYLPNGQRIWNKPVGSSNTPWVAGDYMYLLSTDNTLICFLKYDGRVRWSTKLASYENEEDKKHPINWRGPVMVNGQLAVVSSNGQLLLVSAADGAITATKSVPDDVYTAPVVAAGRMYLMGKNAELISVQ